MKVYRLWSRLSLWLILLGLSSLLLPLSVAHAGANPQIPFYGYGAIVANPAFPIAGENTHVTVNVSNNGDAPATNVRVRLSFNDWGVTFMGWQQMGETVISSIPAGGAVTVAFDHVFVTRTHTCLEALIVSSDNNDDLNDDRGQINLEVINAGDTFAYGVPVRNDGEAPLNLLIVAGRHGEPVGNGPPIEVNETVENIVLQPGEEHIVPIEVRFPVGTPPGTAIDILVDAYDLGAANPFAPAHHNHVRLRVVHQTARNLKEQALGQLQALRGQIQDRSLHNQVSAVIQHIAKSLSPHLWVDASRLKPSGGAAVFAQEKAAAQKLEQLLGKLPSGLKEAADTALRAEVDADRILAQTAQADAGDGPASAAALLLHEGDAARQQGDYALAIACYQSAWRRASR